MKSIWNEIQAKLGLTETEEEDEERLVEYATAALLLEMCESDQDVDPSEVAQVRQSLKRAFGLTESDIETLVARAFSETRRGISFHPQVEIINDHCGPDEKARIVKQLWRVAFADGRLDKYEEHYLRRLSDLIHVPHRVFLRMKHEVEGE